MSKKSKVHQQRKQSTHQLNEAGKDFVSGVGDSVRRSFEEVGQQAEKLGNSLRGKGADAIEAVKARLKSDPWYAIVGTALVAIAVGYVFGRRKSSVSALAA